MDKDEARAAHPAGRLHPEGAPGAMAAWQRSLLGDAQFEALQASQAEARELMLARVRAEARLAAAKAAVWTWLPWLLLAVACVAAATLVLVVV